MLEKGETTESSGMEAVAESGWLSLELEMLLALPSRREMGRLLELANEAGRGRPASGSRKPASGELVRVRSMCRPPPRLAALAFGPAPRPRPGLLSGPASIGDPFDLRRLPMPNLE